MNPILTTFGLIAGPLSLAFVFWCLLAEIGRVRDLLAEADIARIEEGLPEPPPEPVEPEPFRRIDWIEVVVDDEFEALVRAILWPTDALAEIKAKVYAEATT